MFVFDLTCYVHLSLSLNVMNQELHTLGDGRDTTEKVNVSIHPQNHVNSREVCVCVCLLLQVRDATAQDADSQWTQRDSTGPSRVQWTT